MPDTEELSKLSVAVVPAKSVGCKEYFCLTGFIEGAGVTCLVTSFHVWPVPLGWTSSLALKSLCASRCLCPRESWDVVQEYGNSSHPRLGGHCVSLCCTLYFAT